MSATPRSKVRDPRLGRARLVHRGGSAVLEVLGAAWYGSRVENRPRVRRATAADRSIVLHFHRQLYVRHRGAVVREVDAPLGAYRDYGEVLGADVDAMLRGAGHVVFLGELDGIPVGYITGRIEAESRRVVPRRGHLEDWWVDEEARGHGVGRALFDALRAHFRDAGCGAIQSQTWSTNEGARKAHEALGFHEAQVVYRMPLGDD